MRKADYNSIIEGYETLAMELALIDTGDDVALEADGTVTGQTVGQQQAAAAQANTNGNMSQNANGQKADEINARKAVSDTMKNDNREENPNSSEKVSKLQKAMDAVRNFIKKIGSILDNLKRILSNRFKLMVQSDRGFFNLYNKQKQIQKPEDQIKVVSYSYLNERLEQPMHGLMNDMKACLTALSMTNPNTTPQGRAGEIIGANGNMGEVLFKPYCRDSKDPVTSAPEFIKYMVNNYRGEKSEKLYRSDQLGAIERNAMSAREISNQCQAYLRDAEAQYGRIKMLQNQLNNNSDEKVVELVKKNASKAATLYGIYNSVIHMYYEVRLEQSMNYRIVLKRFYHMT